MILSEMVHPVEGTFGGIDHSGLFPPDFPFAQVIETDIGHNAVQPGVETTVETKRMEVLVDPQEGFLVDIPGVLRGAKQVHGNAQDILVVTAHQCLERLGISTLSCSDQCGFVGLSGHAGGENSGC